MSFQLNQKVAVITGGTGGIGQGIAIQLWRAGSHVIILGRNKQRGQEVLEKMNNEFHLDDDQQAYFFSLDLTDERNVNEVFQEIIEKSGRVDILVNCAGVEQHGAFVEIPLEEWNETITTNLTGVFLCTKAVVPTMEAQHDGRIVNIASTGGIRGRSGLSNAYGASKAGVIHLTQSLAVQLGPKGIRVNAISPGLIRTPMTEDYITSNGEDFLRDKISGHPLKRLGTPADIAFAVQYLCSDEASWITGVNLPVDGGKMAV